MGLKLTTEELFAQNLGREESPKEKRLRRLEEGDQYEVNRKEVHDELLGKSDKMGERRKVSVPPLNSTNRR